MAGETQPSSFPTEDFRPPSTKAQSRQADVPGGTSGGDTPTRLVTPDEQDENLVPPGCVPLPGQRLGDFRILEVLGSGSFATVYLALQVSLGRQVALKVATNQDSEARTLASLEHEHIVHVFSETVDEQRGLRLLCMKFVPGTDLEHVMRELARRNPAEWSGQALLDAIDRLCRHEAMFDPAALRDREQLGDSDFVEAVCWLGARLAEALAHAHSRGVLHRDIKPANILLNRYGRPLLSDFNLAFCPQRGGGRDHFGGTFRYMAPEHLEAFDPSSGVPPEAVDRRSDIYSLGVVLYELLTGRPFFRDPPAGATHREVVRKLAAERRAAAPSPRQVRPELPVALDRVIRRCLEPDPGHRYQTAEELARALEGCRELRQMEHGFPPSLPLTRLGERYPVWVFIARGFLPHLLGSVVNITYNSLRIVGDLTEAQQRTFTHILLAYNALVYPFCLWVVCRAVVPVFRLRSRLEGAEAVAAEEVAHLRRRAVTLPVLTVALSCLGWLPGGLLFPLGIHLLSGPVPAAVFGHFLISFTISGLIATTYSYFGVQFFVLRILYPALWVDPQAPSQQARRELGPLEGRLRLFVFAAGLIPLSGAVLLVGVSSPEQFTLGFRLLVVGLIGLGMAGFGAALLVSSRLSRTLSVLTGGVNRTPRKG